MIRTCPAAASHLPTRPPSCLTQGRFCLLSGALTVPPPSAYWYRDFIKRRAEKLTAPKPPRRNKRAGAMGGPARAKMSAAV
jgi:hypothetical protein